ncbi:radical SAM protein [bacterium]|nr:radical SAM protein [bacterium]
MKTILHTDRAYRLKRFGYYFRTVRQALRNNVGAGNYLHLAFDRMLRIDSALPHMLYVEMSNVCNTQCAYCPYPTYSYNEPFLREDVLESIVASLSRQPVDKIMIGGGEPTLHPEFSSYARRLRQSAKFLSVVTNGQWTDDRVTHTLAEGTFDLVEVSVDAGGKEEYERTRKGGKYHRLLGNLDALMRIKRESRSRTIIGIRLMIRPTMRKAERQYLQAWKPYCDTILPQYISTPAGMGELDDAYLSVHQHNNDFPRCTYPSRALQIKSDGTVPLCSFKGHAAPADRILLGDIREHSIQLLWKHPLLLQYRAAHRSRDTQRMPACRGCPGG